MEKIFYIMYRKGNKQIHEKAGRQYADDMTAARASQIRAKRIHGDKLSNKDRREALRAERETKNNIWTVQRLWDEYVKNNPNVFPGMNGGQRTTIAIQVRRIRDKAGLPKEFRPLHGLRHVYASMLASSGKVGMYQLQRLLTHKSPVMTQRYAHLRDEALKRAPDVASDIISELGKAVGDKGR